MRPTRHRPHSVFFCSLPLLPLPLDLLSLVLVPVINSRPFLGGHGIKIAACYLDCDTAKREPVSWCGHADHPAAALVAG